MYGKIVFNNIKEYTPYWIKTVNYNQCAKPILKKGVQKVGKFNSKESTKAFWRFFKRNVTDSPTLWQVYIFTNVFLITFGIYWPWRIIYSANNKMRSIDYAIQKEKNFKKSQQSEEQSEQSE